MTGTTPLVTVLGASGFVGSAVVAALAGRPVRLRAVARRPVAARSGIEVIAADLTSIAAVEQVVAGADAVISLVLHESGWRGADTDPGSERVNVGVLCDVIEVLRARRRSVPPPAVLFAGSTSQVGVPPRVPIDGTEPDRPETAYDRQKQLAEGALKAATAEGAVRGVSLRLPTVFGHVPGAGAGDRGVLATMVRRALDGQPLTVWDDGTLRRDLLHVSDVADAFVAALDHADALAGRHWLLGTGRGERLVDVFRTIAELVSVHTGRAPVPVVPVSPPPHATPTDTRSVVIDSTAFRSATGWRPRVPLRPALGHLVAGLAGSASRP